MNSLNTLTTGLAGRPGMTGLREALGPGFAMVAPTEATLLTATGHGSHRRARSAKLD